MTKQWILIVEEIKQNTNGKYKYLINDSTGIKTLLAAKKAYFLAVTHSVQLCCPKTILHSVKFQPIQTKGETAFTKIPIVSEWNNIE